MNSYDHSKKYQNNLTVWSLLFFSSLLYKHYSNLALESIEGFCVMQTKNLEQVSKKFKGKTPKKDAWSSARNKDCYNQ